MRLSINWLKDFVDLTISPEALGDKLTLAGLEIDALEVLAPNFSGVVVGRAEKVEPHPQADRLQLVEVFDGRQILPGGVRRPERAIRPTRIPLPRWGQCWRTGNH